MKNFGIPSLQNNIANLFDFNFNSNLKKPLILGAGLTFTGASLVLGFPALYTIGATLAGAYVLYPDQIEAWFESHQTQLLGASLGFLHSGLVGLAVGGWLGHFLNKKVNQASEKVHQVVETVKPVATPFRYVNKSIQGAWHGLKSAYNISTGWLSSPAEDDASPTAVENSKPVENTKKIEKPKKPAKKRVVAQSKVKPLALMPSVSDEVPAVSSNHQEIVLREAPAQKTAPSFLDKAGDIFDLMNGQANDETYANYEGSWATKDVFDVASDALGSVKSNVSWLWRKVRGTTTAQASDVKQPEKRHHNSM